MERLAGLMAVTEKKKKKEQSSEGYLVGNFKVASARNLVLLSLHKQQDLKASGYDATTLDLVDCGLWNAVVGQLHPQGISIEMTEWAACKTVIKCITQNRERCYNHDVSTQWT